MRIGISYSLGRICAVVTRPLCLFVANNFFAAGFSQDLAVAFLASTLALIAVAAAPERRFYGRFFDAGARVNGLTFYLYSTSLLLLMAGAAAIAFLIVFHFTGSAWLGAAVMLYCVSEKLADEVLRLRLFEREFAGWGRHSIARSLWQLTGLAALLCIPQLASHAALLVLLLALGNCAVFIPQIPRPVWRNLFSTWRLHTAGWLVRRAGNTLRSEWILWAIALLGSAAGYLDRIMALVLDKESLPLFMLVVMCFALIQMMVDFYYFSRHRRDFLERRIHVGAALRSLRFLGSLAAGLALGAVACVLVLTFSRNGAQFPLGYILAIAALQVAIAVATVPREVLYWSHKPAWILRIEVAFWVIFCGAAVAGYLAGLPVMALFALVATCAAMRLALYLAAASRLAPAGAGAGSVAV